MCWGAENGTPFFDGIQFFSPLRYFHIAAAAQAEEAQEEKKVVEPAAAV